MSKKKQLSFFERFSNAITSWAGSSYAFSTAFVIVIVWAACGPLFDFSETWQLVINTGTTIITFLMVFLIQKSQNKDSKAIQLKLNELIAADERASNRMVDLEDMTEAELDKLHKFYEKLSDLAEKDDDIHRSHSIDAAEENNEQKQAKKGKRGSGGASHADRKPAGRAAAKKPKPGKDTDAK
jgi:low affinity Fe/Cu permease